MNTYEFRVLCSDDGVSCDFVKLKMCDFKIKHISDFPGYDHSGTKDFIDDIAAQKRKDALFQECGDNVLKIDIYDAA